MQETQETTIRQFESEKEGSSYDTYDSYTETDIEWLGKIPDHWSLSIVDQHSHLKPGFSFDSDNFDKQSGFPLIRIRNIKGKNVNTYYNGDISPEMKQVIVEEGDIIVGMDGDFRVYWWDDKKALLNQRMTRITSEDYHDRRYLYYLLPIALEYIQEITASTTVKHLSTNEIRKLKVPSMPHEEREAIVEFLDQETKDIDELIEKKEKLIKLIEERRKAVIKNAVIKGLDSDVDLKESGVDWLGEVPEHWDVPRIRFVARMESGHTPSKSEDEYWDGDIPWVSLADSGWMREHDYISETDKTISEAGLANSSAHILPPETMVFTRDATVGLCAITTREMAVSQHIIGWICEDNLLPEYLLNVTKAMDQELDRLTMGATISTVGMEDIKKLKMPLPPIEEQEEIVEYLNDELEKFDESIEKIREGIERLKEYRTALITESVTGQIDVRGEV